MNNYAKLVCLVLLFCCVSTTHAQYRNTMVLRDSITGKDTLINDVTFKEMTPFNRQKGILVTVWLGEKESVRSYNPTQVARYTESGITYKSKSLVHEGRRQQFLLPEVYQRDSIRIYKFMPEEEQTLYYISIGDTTSLLIPMQDSQKRKGTNAVRTYLESFPIAKEQVVKDYIASMKPTPASFDDRYEVIKKGNPNAITRFRWGIQGGIGVSSLSGKDDFSQNISYESSTSFYGGIFLDIPMGHGFSLHPEVNFQHYANSYESQKSNQQQTKNFLAYNRDDVNIPILVRYTICSLRGKWLPYFQAGPKVDIGIKRELEGLLLTNMKKEGTAIKVWEAGDEHKVENFNIGFTAGLGVEWKVLPKNSLFFDLRYTRDFMDDYTSGYYFSIAFNI